MQYDGKDKLTHTELMRMFVTSATKPYDDYPVSNIEQYQLIWYQNLVQRHSNNQPIVEERKQQLLCGFDRIMFIHTYFSLLCIQSGCQNLAFIHKAIKTYWDLQKWASLSPIPKFPSTPDYQHYLWFSHHGSGVLTAARSKLPDHSISILDELVSYNNKYFPPKLFTKDRQDSFPIHTTIITPSSSTSIHSSLLSVDNTSVPSGPSSSDSEKDETGENEQDVETNSSPHFTDSEIRLPVPSQSTHVSVYTYNIHIDHFVYQPFIRTTTILYRFFLITYIHTHIYVYVIQITTPYYNYQSQKVLSVYKWNINNKGEIIGKDRLVKENISNKTIRVFRKLDDITISDKKLPCPKVCHIFIIFFCVLVALFVVVLLLIL